MRISDTLGLLGLAAATLARRARRGPLRPGWTVRTELAQSLMRAVLMRSKRRGTAWLREAQAALPVRVAFASEVRFEPTRLGGVACEWCIPRERAERTRLASAPSPWRNTQAAAFSAMSAKVTSGVVEVRCSSRIGNMAGE